MPYKDLIHHIEFHNTKSKFFSKRIRNLFTFLELCKIK